MLRAALAGVRAVRFSPVTCAYLLVLLVTSIVRHLLDRQTALTWLHASSTNVVHLEHDPVQSLLAAALLVAGAPWLPWAIVILLTVAVLERQLGARWTALIFISGHVVATLLTELPIALAIGLGWLPHHTAYRLDFGVSYGVATCAVAVAGLARGWARIVVLGVTGVGLVGSVIIDADMTQAGHAIACIVGFGWWWWLARRGLLGTRGWRELWLTGSRRRPPATAEPDELAFSTGAGAI